MQESQGGRRSNLLWLLILLAVILVWWWWRAPGDGEAATPEAATAALADADPDDILVDFRDDLDESGVQALGDELGIRFELVSSESVDERFYRAHVDPARRDALLARLAERAEVEIAEPDALYSLPAPESARTQHPHPDPDDDAAWRGFPNDPLYKFQWHFQQIGMPEAWKLASGEGVIVAVIDTGVAYEDHKRFHRVPDLAETAFAKGFNFVGNDAHANDDHGHGTHVAGTIAQSTHNGVGVAGIGRVTIMPLKVLAANGSGSVAGIADAIRFAADNGAKVINMSLGGRFPSKVLAKAVKYAHDKGVVVVCAAGNDGRGKVSYPAAYPGALAVAATQYDESTTFYSNWGKEIDVAAPGGNTQVDQNQDGRPDGVLQNTIVIGDPTRNDYLTFMGTSMASPHVAGVAALLVSQGVTDPDAVEKVLEETARSPHDQKFDKARYGAGIIDAPAALKRARGATGGWSLGLGLLLAGALAAHARRRGLGVRLGPGYLLGVLAGASGLFFLPYLGRLGAALSSWPVLDMLTRGFPSWDLSILGASGHGNALFFSALAPLAAIAVGYGVRHLRAPLAGFAAGVAGHLLFHAAARVADVQWIPNVLGLDQMWLAVNALVCATLGYFVLRDR